MVEPVSVAEKVGTTSTTAWLLVPASLIVIVDVAVPSDRMNVVPPIARFAASAETVLTVMAEKRALVSAPLVALR